MMARERAPGPPVQIRRQDQGGDQDTGGLDRLPGLEGVREQLACVIAVIQAEAARRQAGIVVARPAWKNLVFAGGPGSGRSRVAAVGRIYRELGVLASGHLVEVASVERVRAGLDINVAGKGPRAPG